MRPFHAAAPFLTALMLAFAAAAAPALAQDDTVAPPSQAAQPVTVSPAEGNWGCIALVDNSKAGLLTVFQGSYGYASATFGSSASGTGAPTTWSSKRPSPASARSAGSTMVR